MSLTSHLKTAGSPVRAFFAERLPHTRPVVAEAAAALRGGHKTAPLAAAPGVDPGRAGTAVDYLLRIALAPAPWPPASAGRQGAGRLGPDLSLYALQAVEEALAFVGTVAPYRRAVSDDEWEDMTRISLLLATFEAVYRSGLPPAALQGLESVPASWREWAAIVCVDAEVEDVAVLGWAAAQDHRALRGRDLVCNPVARTPRRRRRSHHRCRTAHRPEVDEHHEHVLERRPVAALRLRARRHRGRIRDHEPGAERAAMANSGELAAGGPSQDPRRGASRRRRVAPRLCRPPQDGLRRNITSST
jgi:hypothetical protein